MIYRVIVPSARYEDRTTENLQEAWLWCEDLSIEFGYAEVAPNQCGSQVLGCFVRGH